MGATNVAKSGICMLIGSKTQDIPTYMAIGTGSSTFSPGNIALLTESKRNGFSSKYTGSEMFVNYLYNFNSLDLSGTTIAELGLFTKLSAGDMWNREVFSGISYSGNKEIYITVDVEVY